MKVLFPFAYYYPETCAGLYLAENVIAKAADQGIDSLMTVPTPTRNVSPNAKWERVEQLHGGRTTISRFHMYGEGKNPILRALRYLLCEIIQTGNCLFRSYDVVFIDSTPPIQGLKMPLIKWFRRKPIVYNAQDIFPDSLVGTGLTKENSLIWKIGRIVEKITYKYSDKIIVISLDFKKNLLSKGVPEDKIIVVYNWVDEEAVKYVSREENVLFERYGLDRNKFYITYSGNIGLTQNMDMLLEVAKEIESNSEIQFVLIGEGAYKEKVKEIIAEQNISNVILLPFQPYEEISHVFSLGDIGLVISKPGVGANSVPSKTWSILSASRPVLVNFDENELKIIVNENQCGIFTKAGDKEAFKQAILELYHDKNRCIQLGRNGREFILKNLTRAVGTQKYVDVIKSLEK